MNKKSRRRVHRKRRSVKRTFKRSSVAPKRVNVMRGGEATFNNNMVSAAPQSYLPYNDFAKDPNYGVIASRNTGPFLTGVSSGGSRRNRRNGRKYKGGSVASYISNNMNTYTHNTGIIPIPAINESSGVAGVMSGFSNTSGVYNSTPMKLAPLA
jgi:hypothetical protein